MESDSNHPLTLTGAISKALFYIEQLFFQGGQMSEENVENEDYSLEDMDLPDIIVITLTVRDGEPPLIDLGGCHPALASQMFRKATEVLDDALADLPIIENCGDRLFEAYETFIFDEGEGESW